MITTVVGNYPKISPQSKAPSLRAAISRLDRGQITEEELRRVEEEVTKEVIDDQVRAGLDLVTDGQIRWDDGQTYFAARIQGFTLNGLIRYFDTNTYYRQPIAQDKLQWQGPIGVDHFKFAVAHSSKPVKAVITGPYTLARLSQGIFYKDLEPMVMDLADILNHEARALADAGAPMIQFDEPTILKHKEDFTLFKKAMKTLTQGISTKTSLYTYFNDISGLCPDFLRLPFDIIGLDFVLGTDNYNLLKDLPRDKELGLGIVDARNTKMESVDQIVNSIQRVSETVSLDKLHINPNCGLEFLPRPNAYSKLVRMVEGVAKAKEVLA